MEEKIVYKNNIIEVNNPGKQRIVVYAHPKDSIIFNLDLSKLKKTIINGDLVIQSVAGGTITISNYASMFLQNELPQIKDALGMYYSPDDLLFAEAKLSFNDVEKYILSRTISSPDSQKNSGEYLASAKTIAEGKLDQAMLLGSIQVEQQSPIMAQTTFLKPYELRTLHLPKKYQYDVLTEFDYTGSSIHSQDQDYTKTTPVTVLNPTVTPYYGTYYKVTTSSGQNNITTDYELYTENGGGNLSDVNDVKYLYTPFVIDQTGLNGNLYFKGSESSTITRNINVRVNSGSVAIKTITLTGVPDGVKIVSNNDTEAKQVGKGVWEVTPKSQSSSINLSLAYEEGMDPVQSAVQVDIFGYNFKTKKIIEGSSTIILDFHAVSGSGDVLNFTTTNGYTYSTNMDIIHIYFTQYNDYAIGGTHNDIYDMEGGDDIFISGLGSEKVNMGVGSDTFYIGYGSDVVDGGGLVETDGVDVISFAKADYRVNQTTIVLGGRGLEGKISVSINGQSTTFTNFEVLVLDNENNAINVDATSGFNLTIIGLGGSDTINIGAPAVVSGEDASIVIANSGKIYYAPQARDIGYLQEDAIEQLVGSSGKDTFIGGSYATNFNMAGGEDTVDYSNMIPGGGNVGIVYNQTGKNEVVKPNLSTVDTVTNFEKFYGTIGNDTIFSSNANSGNISYYGYREGAVVDDNDTVNYSLSNAGIVIDYTTATIANEGLITVEKSSGVDKLYAIENVIATNYDDTFKVLVDLSKSREFDGLNGVNSLDYSATSGGANLVFSINTWGTSGGSGNVKNQGSFVSDTFKNMSRLVGTSSKDVFQMNSATSVATIDGYLGDYDAITYASNDVALNVNIFTATSGANNGKVVAEFDKSGKKDTAISVEVITLNDKDNIVTIDKYSTLLNGKLDIDAKGQNTSYDADDIKSKGDTLVVKSSTTAVSGTTILGKGFESLEFDSKDGIVYNFDYTTANVSYDHFYGYASKYNKTFEMNFKGYAFADNIDVNIQNSVADIDVNANKSILVQDFNSFVLNDKTNVVNIVYADKSASDYGLGYNIDGQNGSDTLSYEGSTMDLFFDLKNRSVSKESSTPPTGVKNDTFNNMEVIKGGDGDDTFYIDPEKAYIIDGGLGENTISFKYYVTGIAILPSSSSYSNIQNYELTTYNDSLNLNSLSTNIEKINGLGGLDTLKLVTPSASVVSIEFEKNPLTAKSYVRVTTGNYNIGVSEFESFIGFATNEDQFIFNTLDFKTYYNTSTIYIDGGSGANAVDDSLTFSEVDSSGNPIGVALSLVVLSSTDNKYYSTLTYANSSSNVLFFKNIADITLGDGDDIVYLSNNTTILDSLGIKSIDLGGGDNVLSFEKDLSYAAIEIDTAGNISFSSSSNYDITSWNTVQYGNSGGSVTLLYGSGTSNDGFSFLGNGVGLVTMNITSTATSVSALALDLTANNMVLTTTSGTDAIGVNKISNYVFTDIPKVDIKFNSTSSYNVRVVGGTDVQAHYNTLTAAININYTSSTDTAIVNKSQNTDVLIGFNYIEGTSYTDTFSYAFSVNANKKVTYKGGELLGSDVVKVNGVSSAASANIVLSYTAATATTVEQYSASYTISGGANFFESINVSQISGTSGSDTFVISDVEFLMQSGNTRFIINSGNASGTDTLEIDIDFGANTAGEGVIIDPTLSSISLGTLGVANDKSQYLSYRNISVIDLSNSKGGINVLNLTSNSGTLKEVKGDGDDILSYEYSSIAASGEIENLNLGSSDASIKNDGFTQVILTNLNDNVSIRTDRDNKFVGGGKGNDTITYVAGTTPVASMSFDLSYNNNGSLEVNVVRGSNTDTLVDFETIILGADTNLIDINLDNMTNSSLIFDGTNTQNNTVSYANTTDTSISLKVEFKNNGEITVGKFKDGYSYGTDTFKNFNSLTNTNTNQGTEGADTFIVAPSSLARTINVNVLGGDDNLIVNGFSDAFIVIGSGAVDVKNTSTGTNQYHFTYTTEGFGKINGANKTTDIAVNNTFQINKLESANNGIKLVGGNAATNIIDLSGATFVQATNDGMIVDLGVKSISYKNQAEGTAVYNFSNMQQFIGTSKNDDFLNLNATSIYNINGGAGVDSVSYGNVTSSIIVTLSAGSVSVNKGSNNVDTLTNIEAYTGSRNSDTFNLSLAGTSEFTFNGGGGRDTVVISDSDVKLSWDSTGKITNVKDPNNVTDVNIYDMSVWNFTGSNIDINYFLSTSSNSTTFDASNASSTNDKFTLNGNTATTIIFDGNDVFVRSDINGKMTNLSGFETFVIGDLGNAPVNANVSDIDLDTTSKTIDFNNQVSSNVVLNNVDNVKKVDIANGTTTFVGKADSNPNTLVLQNMHSYKFNASSSVSMDTNITSYTASPTSSNVYNIEYNSYVTTVVNISGSAVLQLTSTDKFEIKGSNFSYIKGGTTGVNLNTSGSYSVNINGTLAASAATISIVNPIGLTSFSQNVYNLTVDMTKTSVINVNTSGMASITGSRKSFTMVVDQLTNGAANIITKFLGNNTNTTFNDVALSESTNPTYVFNLSDSVADNVIINGKSNEGIQQDVSTIDAKGAVNSAIKDTLFVGTNLYANNVSIEIAEKDITSNYKNFEVLDWTTLIDNNEFFVTNPAGDIVENTNHNVMVGNMVDNAGGLNPLSTKRAGVQYTIESAGSDAFNEIILPDMKNNSGTTGSSTKILDNRIIFGSDITSVTLNVSISSTTPLVNLSGVYQDATNAKSIRVVNAKVVETGSGSSTITMSSGGTASTLSAWGNQIHGGNKADPSSGFTSAAILFNDTGAGSSSGVDTFDFSTWSALTHTGAATYNDKNVSKLDYRISFANSDGYFYVSMNNVSANQVVNPNTGNAKVIGNQTVMGIKGYEQITVPHGIVLVNELDSSAMTASGLSTVTIKGQNNANSTDVLGVVWYFGQNINITNFLTGNNQTTYTFTPSSGITSTVELYHASLFVGQAASQYNLQVGDSSGNYQKSNKVVIYADSNNSVLQEDQNNNSKFEGQKITVADTTVDTIDFSYINSGSYYFSVMQWTNVTENQATYQGQTDYEYMSLNSQTGLVDTTGKNKEHITAPSTTATQSNSWANFIQGSQYNTGFAFTNNTGGDNKQDLITEEGSNKSTLYKYNGIETIIGTDSSDTFSWGTFYYYNTGNTVTTTKMVSPALNLQKNNGNTIYSINLGEGYDTYLLDSVTVDNPVYQATDAGVSVDRQWQINFDNTTLDSTVRMQSERDDRVGATDWRASVYYILGSTSDNIQPVATISGFERLIIDDWGSGAIGTSNATDLGIVDDIILTLPTNTVEDYELLIDFGGGLGGADGGQTIEDSQYFNIIYPADLNTPTYIQIYGTSGTINNHAFYNHTAISTNNGVIDVYNNQYLVLNSNGGVLQDDIRVDGPTYIDFDVMAGQTYYLTTGNLSSSQNLDFYYYKETAQYTTTARVVANYEGDPNGKNVYVISFINKANTTEHFDVLFGANRYNETGDTANGKYSFHEVSTKDYIEDSTSKKEFSTEEEWQEDQKDGKAFNEEYESLEQQKNQEQQEWYDNLFLNSSSLYNNTQGFNYELYEQQRSEAYSNTSVVEEDNQREVLDYIIDNLSDTQINKVNTFIENHNINTEEALVKIDNFVEKHNIDTSEVLEKISSFNKDEFLNNHSMLKDYLESHKYDNDGGIKNLDFNLTKDQIDFLKSHIDDIKDIFNKHHSSKSSSNNNMSQSEWDAYTGKSSSNDEVSNNDYLPSNSIHNPQSVELENGKQSLDENNNSSMNNVDSLSAKQNNYLDTFTEQQADLDLSALYKHLDNNSKDNALDSDVSSMLKFVSKDSEQHSFNLAETDSMSFALDTDMKISDDNANTIDHHSINHKQKNHNGFGN